MNITLNRELEEWIQERVDGDLYQSASEVIEDAVRLVYEDSVKSSMLGSNNWIEVNESQGVKIFLRTSS